MSQNPLRVIDSNFNIYESGWKKFGNHRSYISQNIDSLINGDIFQERIEGRVVLGFFGHAQELKTEYREDSDNLPSNVTTYAKFYPQSGDVEHKQEVSNNKSGKALISLHDDKIGNFSWKSKGKDTLLRSVFNKEAPYFLRFDYVYTPGFVKQSKKDSIISESSEFQQLLLNFKENGIDIEEAVKIASNWQQEGMLFSKILENFDSMTLENRIQEEQLETFKNNEIARKDHLEEALKGSIIELSDSARAALFSNKAAKDDFTNLISEIEEYGSIDKSAFPGFSQGQQILPESAIDGNRKTKRPAIPMFDTKFFPIG